MAKPRKQAPASVPGQPGRRRFPFPLVVCVGAAMFGILAWLAFNQGRKPGSSYRSPSSIQGPGTAEPIEDDRSVFARYGGSASCRECHEEEYELWKKSHHALAEREVRAQEDRPAFDPARSFRHGTQTTEVAWTNGAAEVIAIGLSGKPEVHTPQRVIGEDPLRQFLVPFPGGRLQVLEAAYDPRSNEWFNVYGGEDRRPGEWGHWTGRGMNWNYMCASCHNTRLRRNYDGTSDSYHTTMAEMSVGCEACHGPLKAHNDWQQQFGKTRQKDPTLVKLDRTQVLDYCGWCHARRTDLTGDFKPGDRFFDRFDLVTVDRTDRYYADGQVRDEDYEYTSFLSSRMHMRGVYCLDCHNPHSMKTLLPGNWLCLRCHGGTETNAPVINPVTHSRHKVFGFDTNGQPVNLDLTTYHPKEIKETGGECVNCHMPQTVYMQRHWRHDHGFTSPDPLLTKQFGIPNACNRCHKDKDADWAVKYCEEWYGAKMERPARRRAQVFARAQRGEPQACAELLAWLGKEDLPFWQAVTLGLLEPYSAQPEAKAALLRGLEHTNVLARTLAANSLESAVLAGDTDAASALQKKLDDPSRSVRIAAAMALRATVDPGSQAGRELQQFLDNNADEPSGQMQKGIYLFAREDASGALRHFEQAIAWDPYSAPLRQEEAVVLSALGRPQEAVEALKAACRLAPNDAESFYKLGLAYNELGDLKQTAEELATAVRLDPRHAAAWYNLGLAQNGLGQTDSAIQSLVRAETVAPEDARIPYARATILARLGRTAEAKAAARRALEIRPGFPEARQLLQTLGE